MKTIDLSKKDSRKYLLKVVKILKTLLKNVVVPICGRVLIKSDRLIATNIDLHIVMGLPFDLKKTFLIDVSNFLSLLEKGDELTINEGYLQAGGMKCPIETNVRDFPIIPNPKKEGIRIASHAFMPDEFKQLCNVASFCGYSGFKPEMSCVFVNENKFVATNGHQLHWQNTDLKAKEILIHQTLIFLAKQLDNKSPYCYSCYKKGKLSYSEFTNDTLVITQLNVTEKYVNYKGAIPDNFTTYFTVDKKQLINELKNCAKINNNRVTFTVKDKLEIETDNLDFNTEYSSSLEISDVVKGQVFEIGFNPNMLSDCLKVAPDDNVTFKMIAPDKGAMINDNILIMPVMLSGHIKY